MRSPKQLSKIANTSQHGSSGTTTAVQQVAQTRLFRSAVLAGFISHAGLTRRVPAWLGQETAGRMQVGRACAKQPGGRAYWPLSTCLP